MLVRLIIPLCFLFLISCQTRQEVKAIVAAKKVTTLGIYDKNPAYWTCNGQPTLLVGGSKEDNLFQIPDLKEHLDELAAAGGNYIRNTLSSRDSGNLWAFARNEAGLYDLEIFDTSYFGRFDKLLQWTAEREILVQVELWDRFDFARDPWQNNPFRPANNINYDTLTSGLSNDYPRHPGKNDNPFFYTVPDLENRTLILAYQQKYINKVLEISLEYDHVLYCMDNETNGDPAWGAYWSNFVKQAAATKGKTVYTTEMWDAWNLKDEEHQATMDHPELYDFVDISQNNHNHGQEHWDNLQWVRQYTADARRPLNHVKIYGAKGSRYGSKQDAIERFWRSFLGGAASIRFHRPPSGLGLDTTVTNCLRAANFVLDLFPLPQAQVDVTNEKLKNRVDNEAYLSFVDGKAYLVYFPAEGAVHLDLSNVPGRGKVVWLDILNRPNTWQREQPVEGGKWLELETPASGHWLALLLCDD